MKKLHFLPALAATLLLSYAAEADWPSVRRFEGDHLLRVALPLGGIGCGSVSLSGRGELMDWEIMNRANKTLSESERNADPRTFFAVRVKGADHESVTMLAGALHPTEFYADEGNSVPQAGLPRFREARFEGAFPFGTVHLSDKDLPVKVKIKGFSPFIPGDSGDSSLPVASIRYEVQNLSTSKIEVSIAAFVRNIVGNDGKMTGFTDRGLTVSGGEKDNRVEFRRAGGLAGITCLSSGVAADSPAYGTFSLVADDGEAELSFRERCAGTAWRRTILEFWDDLADDGSLTARTDLENTTPNGALCLKKEIPGNGKTSFSFAFTWNFPNRAAWTDVKTIVGNWYSALYSDSWDAALKIVPRLGKLEKRSLAFTRKILALDAPDELKEAALSNLSVLKSQTVFRLPSGHLMGWEGVFNHEGSCYGSCTHVWNYENAIACLFPDLARTMRDVEFTYALNRETGAMDFRTSLPLGAKPRGATAADGQMGSIMKVYREWKISSDDAFLRKYWPNVKKALSFAWSKGGWDENKSGLMDGRQHNTMDVDYFGPNPQMGFWYLGALRAAEEMARAADDEEFAKLCRSVFEKGSRRIDRELFNGDYYEQRIPEDRKNAPYQLGRCCLVDQLVGQQMAHLWNLGDLAAKANLKKACESIMKWNFLDDFSRHFNNMRVYCAGDEAGLLMGSWPHGRLEVPFPYFAEVMTGFEYVAAAEMIFQNMDEEALKIVRAVRARHDGYKRNPFNEPECGHNYARSMASWNCLLAWMMTHGGDTSELIYSGSAYDPK
jgi:uncharacterized protein (DUF608 family)